MAGYSESGVKFFPLKRYSLSERRADHACHRVSLNPGKNLTVPRGRRFTHASEPITKDLIQTAWCNF